MPTRLICEQACGAGAQLMVSSAILGWCSWVLQASRLGKAGRASLKAVFLHDLPQFLPPTSCPTSVLALTPLRK